jgi:succinate dehydrogenase/fumarate reductase flavoprotein subunit
MACSELASGNILVAALTKVEVPKSGNAAAAPKYTTYTATDSRGKQEEETFRGENAKR